ncbi:hypothetical protein HOY80DRAFT_1027840 [Tuber brumale]|nr:hypothetical protein HOY80DRAFT_1027840 [Tuber brumale]
MSGAPQDPYALPLEPAILLSQGYGIAAHPPKRHATIRMDSPPSPLSALEKLRSIAQRICENRWMAKFLPTPGPLARPCLRYNLVQDFSHTLFSASSADRPRTTHAPIPTMILAAPNSHCLATPVSTITIPVSAATPATMTFRPAPPTPSIALAMPSTSETATALLASMTTGPNLASPAAPATKTWQRAPRPRPGPWIK